MSRILPGRGTNRNERLHRELNRVVHNTRLGVELAYALITCTFYKHNERIRAARLAKPITAKIQCRKFNDGEKFGLATTPICKSAKQPAAAHNEQTLKLGFLSVIEHCMEHNIPESSPNEVVDTVLSQWNFRRIPVEGDGNCLLTAISLNILDRIMNNDQSLIGAFEREI